MARFDTVDLSGLPFPAVIEPLDYELVLGEMKVDFVSRWPEYQMAGLETDPAVVVLQEGAYRETLVRGRVNDAARAVMLAFAEGPDLDNLAAFYKTLRRVLAEADGPSPAVLESDAEFRARVQIAPEALSVAGPAGAYLYHAMSAHPAVKSAGVYVPAPGQVHVLPLVRGGDGIPDSAVLDAVRRRLRADDVRPLTDVVTVRAPVRVEFSVAARLAIPPGPDGEIVRAAARARLDHYLAVRHAVGREIYRSGLIGALQVEPIESVMLDEPAADIEVGADQVGWCTGIDLSTEVVA